MADTDQESVLLVEEDLEPGPECCIYKVPKRLREVRETAYTPRLISIGPIHHGDRNLANMEMEKLRYHKEFFQRTPMKMFGEFRSFIKRNVKQIRKCYDKFVFETEFEYSKFETMILTDAVFIIELFLRYFEGKDDFLLKRELLSLDLMMDLILLENQLPFFVLEDLYNLAFGSSDEPSFRSLTSDYFDFKGDLSQGEEINHFTDFARTLSIRNHPSNSVVRRINKVYSATMLYEAGVDFKADTPSNRLLDINMRFENGELRIPTFNVGYRTETFTRNMMALEQCHYLEEAYVCSYIEILDYLVDTDKDVDLLMKQGICLNRMGSSSSAAVADMIKNMMVGVVRLNLCYNKIGQDLNQHYDNFWNRTKANLWHVYFSDLWRGAATVAAFMVVLLTLTQTMFAILERAMPTR